MTFILLVTIKKQLIRGGSRAAATSKIERLVIIVNGWKRLTIITIHSILDVAAALDPPLKGDQNIKNNVSYNFKRFLFQSWEFCDITEAFSCIKYANCYLFNYYKLGEKISRSSWNNHGWSSWFCQTIQQEK